MRKSLIILFSLVFLILLSPSYGKVHYVAIEVREGNLFIEGQLINKQTPLEKYKEILGEPSRREIKANIIYTYDKLGLMIYQDPNTKNIDSLAIQLVKKDYSFSPKSVLCGIFIVQDKVFRVQTSQESLKKYDFLKFTPEERSMRFPVTETKCGNLEIVYVFISNRNQLDEIGISW